MDVVLFHFWVIELHTPQHTLQVLNQIHTAHNDTVWDQARASCKSAGSRVSFSGPTVDVQALADGYKSRDRENPGISPKKTLQVRLILLHSSLRRLYDIDLCYLSISESAKKREVLAKIDSGLFSSTWWPSATLEAGDILSCLILWVCDSHDDLVM